MSKLPPEKNDTTAATGAGSFIPPSQRPDGTWRKARRIREGYVPQEEVPLYESKGKKMMNLQRQLANATIVDGQTTRQPIPGLFVLEKPVKKEKKIVNKCEVVKELAQLNINSEDNESSAPEAGTDLSKKLKNLRKRLREVIALEQKINLRQITNPDPDQLAKVSRKTQIALQICEIESQLSQVVD